MPGIFTRIISGEIPCHKIAEDERFLAFLDVFPLVEGHVLVIPKQETDYIFDIEDEQYAALMLFAKKVAVAQKKAISCKKIGVAVVGLEVPHAHVHLVPINQVGDINFSREKLKLTPEKLESIAQKIREAF